MLSPVDGAVSDLALFRFNVLGPFEARYDERSFPVTGVARSVLALLTASPGRVVSVGAIVAGLWGTEPPDGGERAVASYVSRLRRSLGAVSNVDATSVVVTRPPGYALVVPASSVDAVAFETYVEQARRAADAGQHILAAERYQRALALWRGDAYAEFDDHPFARRQRSRLDELRFAAVEGRIDALLAASSSPAHLVADLEGLLAEHPHRERMWAQLMTALYRDGRQADALDAYRRARTILVDELGVEPGAPLRAAERAVLIGDVSLVAPRSGKADIPAELASVTGACVGRDIELSWLDAQLDAAAYEGGRACVVHGPHGIGKTRLMAEFVDRAAQRGVIVRYGSGDRAVEALTGGSVLHVVVVDDIERLRPADQVRVDSWMHATRDRPVLTVLTCGADVVPAPFGELPRLALTPLSHDDVAAVVRIYSPDANESTVSEIVERAEGVPARVHHAVRDWAVGRAGRRINQAVVDLGERRRRLDLARDDIVAGVLEVGRVRAQADAYGGPPWMVTCPYKGLARFERGDSEYFHGRDRLVAELVARLVDAPLVAVVGASGSGKSSVVRAGLLAALGADALPGSGGWRQEVLTPAGTRPDVTGGGRTIMVIDQFEEAFTVLSDAERTGFVDWIVRSIETGAVTVVLTVRSDFYARCAEHPALGRLVAANTVLVPSMAASELREAIERPATLAGLRIEDGLVDLLVAQTRAAAGGLPLLSVALVSLWERRSARTLTVGAFRESGGVAGSVERLGELAFGALSDDDRRDAARRIFLRLAGSTGGETIAARPVHRSELVSVGGSVAAEVLDVLAGRRLVSVADETVEVAHEALFSHWSRLRDWLADDASGRALRSHLSPAARAWAEGGRDAGELYRGARLAAVMDWAASHANELIPIEREFLDASRTSAIAEQMRQRRNVRRLRTALASAITALVVAVTGVVVAANQQRRAEVASRTADAERLGSQALVEPDVQRAMLLAATADRLDDNWQTRGNLLATLLRTPNVIHAVKFSEVEQISAQAMSVDGRLIAVAGPSGTIRVFDAPTLRPTATLAFPVHGWVYGMSFTLDGKRLVAWGGGLVAKGFSGKLEYPPDIVTWDLASGRQIGAPFGIDGSSGGSILADGRTVVVAQPPTAAAWDLDTRRLSTVVHLPDIAPTSLNVSSDRRKVLIDGHDGISIIDTTSGSTRLLRGVHGFPALSPDGRMLAVTDPNGGGDIAVWDMGTGKLRGIARRDAAAVSYLAWSPDSSSFLSASDDAAAIVWDSATLVPRLVLTGHAAAVNWATYSPDGRTVYTTGVDGMLLEWDISESRTLDRLTYAGRGLSKFDPLSFDRLTGQFLVDVQEANDVLLYRIDASTSAEVAAPMKLSPDTNVIQVSPNGRYLTVSYANGGAQTFDARSGRQLTPIVTTSGVLVRFAETDPTGRILAVADRDEDFTTRVELFDVPSGRKLGGSLPLSAANGGLEFSPDGRYLAAGMANGKIAIFDVAAHRLVTELPVYPVPSVPNVLVFSPDGQMLAVGGLAGQLSTWHVGSWTRAWTASVITNEPTGFIRFSPSGRLIALSNGKLLLFDATTGETIGTSLMSNATIPAFSDDGRTMVVFDTTAHIHQLDVDPQSWVQRACSIAGRDMSADEWRRYVSGRPYIAVCPASA